MPILNDFFTKDEAAKFLGVSRGSINRFVGDGRLKPHDKRVGVHYLYSKAQVEKLKKALYPDGLSYKQIATRYGVSVNTVKRNFKRYSVRPLGRNKKVQSFVFDPDTVENLARLLGWQENPTSEPSDPAAEDSATS